MPAPSTMDAFQSEGTNPTAPFSLKLHRGDGMTLLGMNWREPKPPKDLVGFAIEYKEPDGSKFYPLKNRLTFAEQVTSRDANKFSSLLSPFQKFRWVHFPRNAEMKGEFTYRVTPVFMNSAGELNYGEQQTAGIVLQRETYNGQLNVTFTRGFVASQAFVDFYESAGPVSTLLPAKSNEGLTFKPTHPKTKEALAWMGFEARHAILEVLDKAIADTTASVSVVAYDLSEPEVVSRLVKLKKRLRIIIDDSDDHGEEESGESQAEKKLVRSAGRDNVKRQH
ncbi:MAG: phospholipase, partial [Chitinophagaceae bacterium]